MLHCGFQLVMQECYWLANFLVKYLGKKKNFEIFLQFLYSFLQKFYSPPVGIQIQSSLQGSFNPYYGGILTKQHDVVVVKPQFCWLKDKPEKLGKIN